ncbi:TonB-dependent receptor domain-containing protein [Silvibacterium acidisoli]|uniref:TonB-dependent receptor domain-containing protein n=1 Tax=Acidobacteriaceae bacterium ZG23-2 TaxID=2883246 RepID=UPI00406CE819
MSRKASALVFLCLFFTARLFAQADNASLTGFIQDTSKAFIPGVHVLAIDTDTNQHFETITNRDGSYSISALPVGPYRLQIEKVGFRTLLKEGLFLHTQDVLQINFEMAIGSTAETVTVNGAINNVNTTDGSVGTVIDRQFVDNIPMNGRSFQTLILLSPGTTTNTPQVGAGGNDQGEFSVNGMRNDANNFTVDGTSASNQAGIQSAAGSAGMLNSSTVLGTTQAMLQVDAMEEFRISTSTYSAEYGRQPGAQVTLRSRSGTNEYHGTAYDYFRNSALDANNWFNTYSSTPIPTPAERQNDFGTTLGGPLSIPHLYDGKGRAFFFFAFEGLRLDLPQAAVVYDVPSNGTFNTATYANPLWKNLRANAPAVLRPVLNAFPLPNCSTAQDPQCIDYGLGGSPYLSSPWSNAALDSSNVRVDYQLLPTMRVFARYADTTSNTTSLSAGGPSITTLTGRNRTYLVGADNIFADHISNELRLQYNRSLYVTEAVPTQIGGATDRIDIQALEGLPPQIGESVVHISLPNTMSLYEDHIGSQQFQPNGTDALIWAHGRHTFKFGVDYRQTTAYYNDGDTARSPYVAYGYTSAASVLANTANYTAENELRVNPTYKNLGLFAQDEWHILPRLSLSLGLRWDLNPPPTATGAQAYTYSGNIDDPSTLALSSKTGGALYKTTYTDFAPRFGIAYTLRSDPAHELVLRGGAGLFYDLISMNGFYGNGEALGTSATSTGATAFPLGASTILAPITGQLAPSGNPLYFYPANNAVPPSSVQWNVSLEQALGNKQTLTMGYVGSEGRNLMRIQRFSFGKINPEFGSAELYVNGPGSNYNSLQVKYQRQMSRGTQVLASYTWSHSIDAASTEDYNVDVPFQRGNSDFDVRSNLTAAAVYNLPANYSSPLKRALLGGWNTDLWIVARTAFPYEQVGPAITDPASGETIYGELNYNGKYPYVHKPGIPGGRQIDPTIFSVTTGADGVGNAPRNFLRGFGEAQANVAIQREFPLYERYHLQFRAEAFNITNHPNFGIVSTTCGVTVAGATCNSSIMGQPTKTLSESLGGLSSEYQQGGPRSLQLALKFKF